jgi:cation:H+ antiporter
MSERLPILNGLLLLLGLGLCVGSAEIFVRGASRLASRLGISPLSIGLTIVAFGTSAPELAVSLRSALAGEAGIAVGNLVGSNIFNVWGVLGVAAVTAPLVVQLQLVRVHVPFLVFVSALAYLLVADGRLGLVDSFLLLTAFGAFLGYLSREVKRRLFSPDRLALAKGRSAERVPSRPRLDLLLIAAGLGGLILGASWTVRAAVDLATALGVSTTMVGLTIVAVGTSLPELLTSLIAAIRGERDIAIGNIVGSNVFNITCILGISGLAAGGRASVDASVLGFSMPVMVAGAAACLLIFFTGRMISRWEGGLFLLAYAAFLAHEIIAATGDVASIGHYTSVLRACVACICIVLVLSLVRDLIARQRLPGKPRRDRRR